MFSKLFYHSTHAKDIVANKYYTFFRLSFFTQTICFFFFFGVTFVYTSCDPYATFFIKSHNIFLRFILTRRFLIIPFTVTVTKSGFKCYLAGRT